MAAATGSAPFHPTVPRGIALPSADANGMMPVIDPESSKASFMRTTASMPLAQRLWPTTGPTEQAVRGIALALIGTLVLTLSAKVQVPFWPVPATLQSLCIVMIGATFGARLGLATVMLYLVEGAAGLPVFAGTPERGIGLAYMVGPTGGYLLGFLVAAYVVGRLVESGFARSLPTIALSVLAAHAAIHGFGLLWLGSAIGFEKAIAVGYLPFVPADLVKMALSTALMWGVGRKSAV
jgi:biotin transport system substrate-specific component